MKTILNDVDKFRKENPSAADYEVIKYLKKLGYSDIEIKNYFSEGIQGMKYRDQDDCHQVPDIDEPFDFPEDIDKELR